MAIVAADSQLQKLIEANRQSMARATYTVPWSLHRSSSQQQQQSGQEQQVGEGSAWLPQPIRLSMLRHSEFPHSTTLNQKEAEEKNQATTAASSAPPQSSALIVSSLSASASATLKRPREGETTPRSVNAAAASGALVAVSAEELADRMRRQTVGDQAGLPVSLKRNRNGKCRRCWLVTKDGCNTSLSTRPISGLRLAKRSMIKIWDLSSGQQTQSHWT